MSETLFNEIKKDIQQSLLLSNEGTCYQTIKSCMETLRRREKQLLKEISIEQQQTSSAIEARDLLERVSTAIARIIDIASHLARSSSSSFSSFSSSSTNSDSSPPPLTQVTQTQLPTPLPPQSTPPQSHPQTVIFAPLPSNLKQQQQEQEEEISGPPEINPKDIILDKLIGEGQYGKVFSGSCKGKIVAIKVPHKQKLSEHEKMLFKRELTIMKRVFHPNIVLCLGASMDIGHPLMIVTELLTGDLESYLHPKQGPEPKVSVLQRLHFMYESALGLNWLHGICSILHRDLKPANLLLDEHGHIKITDFGFSQIIHGHAKDPIGPRGTAIYMAPEIMKGETFDFSSDVYSFAMILYGIFTNHEPFEQFTELEELVHAVCDLHQRPQFPDRHKVHPSVIELINNCWDPEPTKRPSFEIIVKRLEDIMITVAIPDLTPYKFWKSHFSNPFQEKVPITTFSAVIARELVIPVTNVLTLSDFLIGFESNKQNASSVKCITMERFNQLCVWFGNNWFKEQKDFAQMIRLNREQWFHNDIPLEEAQSRLQTRAENTFLIRLSFKDPRAPYTLSTVQKANQCEHRRIYRIIDEKTGVIEFAIQQQDESYSKFKTIFELVDGLQMSHSVGMPCPHDKPHNFVGYQ